MYKCIQANILTTVTNARTHERVCITMPTINIRGEKISSYTCYRLINPIGFSLSAFNPFTYTHTHALAYSSVAVAIRLPKLTDYTLIHAIQYTHIYIYSKRI